VTLHGLLAASSVAATIDALHSAGRAEFATRFGPGRGVALWAEDVAYADDALIQVDVTHRHPLNVDTARGGSPSRAG
ncbi:hypothetical protein ACC691_41770, partial [Rhizobium johnstonii]|uniref:hypothetical protein n=1 Tax=Rhizobium johnstonii TaxID=3019933 RepID=UPI003F9631B3